MPEVYDLVVKRWATWNQAQKRACATRITETFGELAQRNAHKNTVPPSDAVGARVGLKSEVTSENRSARHPKFNSSQNSAAELPHRAVASIRGHRTEAKTDALTAVEERALIAAEGRRQRLAEEKNRQQRESGELAQIAAEEQRRAQNSEAQERLHRESTCIEPEISSNQHAPRHAAVPPTPATKTVGIVLGFAIYLVPWIFAWITLLPGYSKTARRASLGWLSFITALFLVGSMLPP